MGGFWVGTESRLQFVGATALSRSQVLQHSQPPGWSLLWSRMTVWSVDYGVAGRVVGVSVKPQERAYPPREPIQTRPVGDERAGFN